MRKLVLLPTVALVFCATASATPVALSTLLGGGCLYVGDKQFCDFHFSAVGPVTANEVNVDTLADGRYGIEFTGPLYASDGYTYDYVLKYSVATTNGAPLINGIGQAFNLSASGDGSITIGESVWDGGFQAGSKVAQSTVAWDSTIDDPIDPNGEVFQGDQLVVSPPLAKVWVTKDVLLKSADGTVGATILTQWVTQVPEPGFYGLVAAGLGTLLWFRKRQ
jgi:hypothetical protein